MILFKERPLRVSIQSLFTLNLQLYKTSLPRFHIVNLERKRRMPRGDQSGNTESFSERVVVLFASHPHLLLHSLTVRAPEITATVLFSFAPTG